MLTELERKVMNHYFLSFPQHLRMQAIIDDAISDNPKLLYTVQPLFSSLPLSHVMAAVCSLITTFS